MMNLRCLEFGKCALLGVAPATCAQADLYRLYRVHHKKVSKTRRDYKHQPLRSRKPQSMVIQNESSDCRIDHPLAQDLNLMRPASDCHVGTHLRYGRLFSP